MFALIIILLLCAAAIATATAADAIDAVCMFVYTSMWAQIVRFIYRWACVFVLRVPSFVSNSSKLKDNKFISISLMFRWRKQTLSVCHCVCMCVCVINCVWTKSKQMTGNPFHFLLRSISISISLLRSNLLQDQQTNPGLCTLTISFFITTISYTSLRMKLCHEDEFVESTIDLYLIFTI